MQSIIISKLDPHLDYSFIMYPVLTGKNSRSGKISDLISRYVQKCLFSNGIPDFKFRQSSDIDIYFGL